MHGVYNPLLVFLSLVVASLAAYTALELTGRIASLPGWKRRLPWLVGGAVAMGVGIWSMHFIGMMAFSLPIPLGYTLGPTVLSLLIAVLVSGFALAVSASGRFRFRLVLFIEQAADPVARAFATPLTSILDRTRSRRPFG